MQLQRACARAAAARRRARGTRPRASRQVGGLQLLGQRPVAGGVRDHAALDQVAAPSPCNRAAGRAPRRECEWRAARCSVRRRTPSRAASRSRPDRAAAVERCAHCSASTSSAAAPSARRLLARHGQQQAIAPRMVRERGKQRSRGLVDAIDVVDRDQQRVPPADAQEPLRERRLHREPRRRRLPDSRTATAAAVGRLSSSPASSVATRAMNIVPCASSSRAHASRSRGAARRAARPARARSPACRSVRCPRRRAGWSRRATWPRARKHRAGASARARHRLAPSTRRRAASSARSIARRNAASGSSRPTITGVARYACDTSSASSRPTPASTCSRSITSCAPRGRSAGSTLSIDITSRSSSGGCPRPASKAAPGRAPGLVHLRQLARGIRRPARQREIHRRAERKHIRAPVHERSMHDFRRDERGRADDMTARTHRDHRAEVDQLGAAGLRAAHVARRDVAMHQPPRVEQRERRAHVETRPRTHRATASAPASADRRRRATPSCNKARARRCRSRRPRSRSDARAARACGTRVRSARAAARLRSSRTSSCLSASLRPVLSSIARYTRAMPPRPSSPSMR